MRSALAAEHAGGMRAGILNAAGVAAGSAVLAICGCAVFALWRRRRDQQAKAPATGPPRRKSRDGISDYEMVTINGNVSGISGGNDATSGEIDGGYVINALGSAEFAEWDSPGSLTDICVPAAHNTTPIVTL